MLTALLINLVLCAGVFLALGAGLVLSILRRPAGSPPVPTLLRSRVAAPAVAPGDLAPAQA